MNFCLFLTVRVDVLTKSSEEKLKEAAKLKKTNPNDPSSLNGIELMYRN